MVEAKTEEEIAEMIKKYHSDQNGFYSMRKDNGDWYKKRTSFWHTMFMPNVCILYISILALTALGFIFFLFY